VYDVKAAVRWLRANAVRFSIDPDRIGVTGGSAGGTLALFLGLTPGIAEFESFGPNLDQSSRVSAVVDYYGATDFTKSYGKSVDAAEVLPPFLGGDLDHARAVHIRASPLHWVSPSAAAVLAVHGTNDRYVEYARQFFAEVLKQAQRHLSKEHFTVDGTMIEAWASQKSFQRKDGGGDDRGSGANFHGEKRTNETHASKTDPDARLYKKSPGSEAKLSYLGHVMVENRHGFIVDAMLTQADGTAEADAAILMADAMRRKKHGNRFTLGADKAYDSRDLVTTLQAMNVTPHVTQNNKNRRSAIDGRTTRRRGYGLSQSRRPIIERTFAWLKSVAGMRKVKLRGVEKVSWLFQYAVAAYNLWRIPRLAPAGA
jgi:Transposase DDE domain/alpha/beta hydrolase fold